MQNIIIAIIVLACVGGAAFYIHKKKKQGVKCIGCPCSKSCSGHCGCRDSK